MIEQTNSLPKIDTELHRVDEALQWMSKHCGPHDLSVSKEHELCFKHRGTTLSASATSVGQIEYGVDVSIGIEDLANSYSISLPITGYQELEICASAPIDQRSKVVQSNITTGIIISPGSNYQLHISGNCRKTLLRISRKKMDIVLSSMLKRRLESPIVFDAKMDAKLGSSAAWWRTIKLIEAELQISESLYNNELFISGMEETLIKGLLGAQRHNYSDELRAKLTKGLPGHIEKTKAFIEQNTKENIGIEDILAVTNTPRSRLYSDFKKYLNEPPTSYLKRLRLEGARQEIMQSEDQGNLSTIAMNWGLTHLGRFSQDYKAMFDELPSETLKRRLKFR